MANIYTLIIVMGDETIVKFCDDINKLRNEVIEDINSHNNTHKNRQKYLKQINETNTVNMYAYNAIIKPVMNNDVISIDYPEY